MLASIMLPAIIFLHLDLGVFHTKTTVQLYVTFLLD